MKLKEMDRFDEALTDLSSERPTDGLEGAIAAFLPATKRGRQISWLAIGAVGTAALIAAFLALPGKSEAQQIREVGDALKGARIQHTTTRFVGYPGDEKTVIETWTYGKKSRFGFAHSPKATWTIRDGHQRWNFDPRVKKVVVVTDEGPTGTSDSLPDLAEQIRRQSPQQPLHLRETTRDGKQILELTLEGSFTTNSPKQGRHDYPFRMVWIANADDKLPREMLSYRSVHSKETGNLEMKLMSVAKFDYPDKLPPKVFDTTIPSGWKVRKLEVTKQSK